MSAETIGFLIGFAVVLPVVLLISAVILRAAVAMYNALVGGPESPRAVPKPTFKQAIGIIAISAILNWIITSAVGYGVQYSMNTGLLTYGTLTEAISSTLLSFLAMAAIVAYRLPTRFGRAMGVTLCHSAVWFAVAFVAVLIGLAAGVSLAGMQ
jgi:hypothetical protein